MRKAYEASDVIRQSELRQPWFYGEKGVNTRGRVAR